MRLRPALAALALALAAPAAAAPVVERFAVVAGGRTIGTTVATIDGPVVEVELRVDDNGRGEKERERIELGPDGVPVRWTVEGTRNVGAPVREAFERTATAARWRSLDGEGEAPQPGPALYLPNDGSSWALGLYLRLLRQAPEGRLPVLPAGELRAERIREAAVPGVAGPVTAWAIWGLGLAPTTVLAAADGRYLGAVAPGYLVVDEALAGAHEALDALAQSLELVLLELTRRRDAGEVLGPRTDRVGLIEGRSPFSANTGFVVASAAEGLEKVRWYADHGYSGVKLYNSIDPAWVKPLAAEAHRLGLRVSGHVPAFMTADRALQDGYDEICHVNQLALSWVIGPKDDTRTPFRFTALGERLAGLDLDGPAVRRTIALLKARRATLDPTMAIFQDLLLSRPGRTTPADAPWLDHLPASVQRFRRAAVLDVKPERWATYEASWRKLQALLRLLDREGVALVPGTDNLAGFVLHSELAVWAEAGLAPARVLRAATLDAARAAGLDPRLGRLTPGAPADLLLVPGDPTRDLQVLRRARLVMTRGAAYFPDEIHQALGVQPFAARPRVTLPAAP